MVAQEYEHVFTNVASKKLQKVKRIFDVNCIFKIKDKIKLKSIYCEIYFPIQSQVKMSMKKQRNNYNKAKVKFKVL